MTVNPGLVITEFDQAVVDGHHEGCLLPICIFLQVEIAKI